MKYLLTASCIVVFASCAMEKKDKKYYIVIKQEQQSLTGDGYEPNTKIDSVEVANDSLAYWEGIRSFTASKMAEKKIAEAGVSRQPIRAKDFDILDNNKESIVYKISKAEKAKAVEYMESH